MPKQNYTRARVATVCQGQRFFRTIEENRAHVLGLLNLALKQKPDLVCLPETFPSVSTPGSAADKAETVPGPTVDACAKRARENRCYIICPVETNRDGHIFNSAVVIDRNGDVLGIYDKLYPVTTSSDYTELESGVTPGTSPGVFDTDFGKIGIRICFDVGFPESWAEMARLGVRLAFWPSAYNGGFPLNAYAALHRMYVVTSVRTDRSRIIDPLGTTLAETDRQMNILCRDINLDFAVCHYDFNYSIPDLLLRDYAGRVAVTSRPDDGLFLVEPTDPAVTMDELTARYGFESADQYYCRHREAIPLLRQGGLPAPQQAAHGKRPLYAKW